MRGQLMNGSHEKTLPPNSHGTWMPNSLVDDAEVVVQETGPDEQREEARDRVRDDEDRAVEALEAQPALVERDREEEADGEREEDGRGREDERPGEDRQKGLADERVVDDLAEVAKADVGLPARLELLLGVPDTNEPSPLSWKTLPSVMRTKTLRFAS